jgi:hypothetical protein
MLEILLAIAQLINDVTNWNKTPKSKKPKVKKQK